MEFPKIDLSKFLTSYDHWLIKGASGLFGPTLMGLFPANFVFYKNVPIGSGDIPLHILAGELGITDQKIIENLKYHQRRLGYHGILSFLILISLFLMGMVLFISPLIELLVLSKLQPLSYRLLSILPVAILFCIGAYMFIAIGFKVGAAIINRFFAETLCILAVIHTVFSLAQDDVLSASKKKIDLLYRAIYLSKHTSLLSLSFSHMDDTNKEFWGINIIHKRKTAVDNCANGNNVG
jgi:hypothetical protein